MLESSVVRETVTRSHSDIRWLQDALRDDHPGLHLPEIPERSKETINTYFAALLDIEQLQSSYTLHFFASCVSDALFKDFKEKAASRRGNNGTLVRDATAAINRVHVGKRELSEIQSNADNLKEIIQGENADLDQLSSKVNDLAGYSIIVFAELKKSIEELRKQIATVSKSFDHIADLFGNLSLQARKADAAKEQFPEPRLQQLDLESVFAKYKLLFYNTGELSRVRAQPAGKIRGPSELVC